MDIEITQVLTQALAFLIMLAVLKRFAWKPLLGALEARRASIQEAYEAIERQKDEIQKLQDEYTQRLNAIEELAKKKIQEAIRQGQSQASTIQEEAKVEARAMLTKARGDITQEIDKAKKQLRDDVASMAIEIAEKVIQSELDPTKHRKLIAESMEKAGFL
jgi:F-type H+-transporting ATPase subunit b